MVVRDMGDDCKTKTSPAMVVSVNLLDIKLILDALNVLGIGHKLLFSDTKWPKYTAQ